MFIKTPWELMCLDGEQRLLPIGYEVNIHNWYYEDNTALIYFRWPPDSIHQMYITSKVKEEELIIHTS